MVQTNSPENVALPTLSPPTKPIPKARQVRILLVDDDDEFRESLSLNLVDEGFAVTTFADGPAALDFLAGGEGVDVILLDWRMPGMNGLEVLRELRQRGTSTPVIFLTALSDDIYEEAALGGGAVDFIDKSRRLSILVKRLELIAEGQRPAPDPNQTQTRAQVRIGALELRSGETTIHLTLMESELLRHLVRNDGKIVSRKQILEEVWGLHEDTDTRAIDNFIVRLRRYIEDDPGHPRHLLTVRGVGYKFLAKPEK